MVKYQFFVGSTYKDLVDERQVAINAIIETNNIVAGMEFFGAVGENQLEHIKQEIDQTDYYLLIIGGRYGSLTKSGISYTEEEYDYAVLNGVRVTGALTIFWAMDIQKTLNLVSSYLKQDGVFIFSWDHPFMQLYRGL